MTSPLQTEVSWDGVVATVTVTGGLDITAARALRRRLLEVASAHPERLVLDLGGLVLVDAACAKALDNTRRLLEARSQVTVRKATHLVPQGPRAHRPYRHPGQPQFR
jgi:anti-anti-sigma regulatory factor